jgi:deazaflavin-dependent oxidoreductase (nitroreductase family)
VTEEIHDNATGWVAKDIRRYLEGRKHRFYGHDTLLLTTRGRRTGKLRRTPLFYGRDGDRYVLVGSNGGVRTHPDWYFNVLANPAVVVQVRDETFSALARPATAEERPPLWEMMIELVPQYVGYQKKLRRELPVVLIEPQCASSTV